MRGRLRQRPLPERMHAAAAVDEPIHRLPRMHLQMRIRFPHTLVRHIAQLGLAGVLYDGRPMDQIGTVLYVDVTECMFRACICETRREARQYKSTVRCCNATYPDSRT